jgi:hypothetical protein
VKLASPVLVTEKLPGMLPAATVSTSGAAGRTVGRIGCWGRQAITPSAGGGLSDAHVHPPGATTHAKTSATSRNQRNDILTPRPTSRFPDREYSAIMGVVQAARYDLSEAKASPDVLNAVDRILVNEAEVAIKTVTGGDGASKKVAVKRVSQEALRAEIARDARALLELSTIHGALKKRKVDKPWLTKLAAR